MKLNLGGFAAMLSLGLTYLKLGGVIGWSWWLVFAPILTVVLPAVSITTMLIVMIWWNGR